MPPGTIYVLVNSALKGLLKIGKTTKTAEERAAELSRGTGIPRPFVVAYDEYTEDCDLAEKLIHSRLEEYRFEKNKNREFFEITLRDALKVVMGVIEEVNEKHANTSYVQKVTGGVHEQKVIKKAKPEIKEVHEQKFIKEAKPKVKKHGRESVFSVRGVKVHCKNCSYIFEATLLPRENHTHCPKCNRINYV